VLYQYAVSPFCEKVRRLLHAKGVPFRVEEVSLARSVRLVPKLSPIRRLPVLDLDGRRLWDSTEIAYALEELYPEPPLIPADPAERARCHVLEDWADESLYFYEMTMRFLWPANVGRWVAATVHADPRWSRSLAPVLVPRALRKRAVPQGVGRKPRELVLRELDRHLDALAAMLAGGEWLVGERLSLADIAVASQLTAIAGAKEGEEALGRRPEVRAWVARVDRTTGIERGGATATPEGEAALPSAR